VVDVLFLPFRVGAGVLAGLLGKRLFGAVWGLVDHGEPPSAHNRRASMPKLALALAIDGAIVRLLKGFADHGTRELFVRLTGRWPGEAKQDSK
jgi:hypothetical protein